ncbi:hypothetical protein FOZG_18534 [Fusarium oxysporum Fo47]|uniref:Uncharacterized protein n=1 Tax=Fusarium oxysporum Fo47 TaxID=660027 RepID=W9JBD1_FUSOX|nr:hypothetical protein FOZG_18534 [Fusarium oxysporum Fo47]
MAYLHQPKQDSILPPLSDLPHSRSPRSSSYRVRASALCHSALMTPRTISQLSSKASMSLLFVA